MKKIYAQNDLQVVLQYFLEKGQHIALVVDKREYMPLVKRELMHILGTPSWNEGAVVRYTDHDCVIKIVSKASSNWEQSIRGMARDSVYYVEGWNVDDVRHSPYCACEEPDEADGYYISAEGKMVEDNICDVCGRRISDEPVSAEGNIELVGLRAWVEDNMSAKRDGKPPEFKQELLGTCVEHGEDE